MCLVHLLATHIFTCEAIPLRSIPQKSNCFPVRNYIAQFRAIKWRRRKQALRAISRNGIAIGNPSCSSSLLCLLLLIMIMIILDRTWQRKAARLAFGIFILLQWDSLNYRKERRLFDEHGTRPFCSVQKPISLHKLIFILMVKVWAL